MSLNNFAFELSIYNERFDQRSFNELIYISMEND